MFFLTIYIYVFIQICTYKYIYLLVLRNNVDLPQVKIKPFCLILVDANLKFYLHGCCVFNIDTSFSEIVDSESSGCCMILLKCISFRDILLFWIPGTVGIQIDIFLWYLIGTAATRSFIESPFDLYGWLSFHDLLMPKIWKICILFSVDLNSILTPATSELSIVCFDKNVCQSGILGQLGEWWKEGCVVVFNICHQIGRMKKTFESTISFGRHLGVDSAVEAYVVRHFRLILFWFKYCSCFSVWPKCLGWGLELEICWNRLGLGWKNLFFNVFQFAGRKQRVGSNLPLNALLQEPWELWAKKNKRLLLKRTFNKIRIRQDWGLRAQSSSGVKPWYFLKWHALNFSQSKGPFFRVWVFQTQEKLKGFF